MASSREHDPARITSGLAALVLAKLPPSLAERKLNSHTKLPCRIRALTLEQCAAYGLDDTATAQAIIRHILDHLTGYLHGLDAPPPHHLLPVQPLCDTVQAWVVNRLGDASEQYPEVVFPLRHRAAEDYRPAGKCEAGEQRLSLLAWSNVGDSHGRRAHRHIHAREWVARGLGGALVFREAG